MVINEKIETRNQKARQKFDLHDENLNKSETAIFGIGATNSYGGLSPSEMNRNDTNACCCCISYNCGGAVTKKILEE